MIGAAADQLMRTAVCSAVNLIKPWRLRPMHPQGATAPKPLGIIWADVLGEPAVGFHIRDSALGDGLQVIKLPRPRHGRGGNGGHSILKKRSLVARSGGTWAIG